MTFDTFDTQGHGGPENKETQSLSAVYNSARHFADSMKGWLVLIGPYGCGKTHLAAAIANFAIDNGVPTMFAAVPDLLDWLRFSYENTAVKFEDRFDEIRNVNLLILDDLGTQNATNWAREKLFQIINHRYIRQLPTVITTNVKMEMMEERIRSRLLDPDLVMRFIITAPDYRRPAEETIQHKLSSLNMHARQTFGNFSLRDHEKIPPDELDSLKKAFNSAQHYAENPQGWLVFMGSTWIGKTHLAASIGNYRTGLGDQIMFVVVSDLLDHLRSTFNPSSTISYDQLFEDVLTARLLILDDLGTQSATPWAREKIYQIFNHRYNAELPTVITTTQREDEVDPRISARMQDRRLSKIQKIVVPQYHTQQTKAEKSPRSRRSAN